jgi:hypothetical protein
MSILIIPDVHEELEQFNYILTKYSHIKEKIALGDFYDSFDYNSAKHAGETARIHADFIANQNNICLWGNHDLQYAFPKCYELGCSGWGGHKQIPIDTYMKDKWKSIRLYVWKELNGKNWLLSHAGFHPSFGDPIVGLTKEYVDDICESALSAVKFQNTANSILHAGRSRGGYQQYGGCTWQDWSDFIPIEGINQVVGHTKGFDIRAKSIPESENYCIDTGLNHVAILDDNGNIIIEKV